MKKIIKKLDLSKETVSYLNNHLPANGDAKLMAMMGGSIDPFAPGPYISKTRGTIYHCPSYPNYCPPEN